MKIAVISDTHIPRKSKVFPLKLLEGLKGVDLILHAGDINRDYVLYELEEIAPVQAVAGNTDDDDMVEWLGRKRTVQVGNFRIGLIHGDGSSGTTLERVRKAFEGDAVDCVVYGHSHIPAREVLDDVLYFNPGSPTDKRRQRFFSYGLLDITDKGLMASIQYF